jgi:hypothetical protein
MDDSLRVAAKTSFAVRIEDGDGIDLTDGGSICFTINDGVHNVYERDLRDTDVVRTIKLNEDPDSRATHLWAVYDRSMEAGYGNYAYDKNVHIQVDAKDRRGDWMTPRGYDFNIETQAEHNQAEVESPDTGLLAPAELAVVDPENIYDVGIKVTEGSLEGAMIVYDGNEPVGPTFGPTEELPPLDAPGTDGVGVPMNLQPPTVFTTPVKILIPCPGAADVSKLSVYFFNGEDYILACDGGGQVQPGATGWMVPGSRVDHPETDPSSIELKVYHFTGVQAGLATKSADMDGDTAETVTPVGEGGSGGGGGGCFISTAKDL